MPQIEYSVALWIGETPKNSTKSNRLLLTSWHDPTGQNWSMKVFHKECQFIRRRRSYKTTTTTKRWKSIYVPRLVSESINQRTLGVNQSNAEFLKSFQRKKFQILNHWMEGVFLIRRVKMWMSRLTLLHNINAVLPEVAVSILGKFFWKKPF